jgi:hypothetical protein
MALATLDEVAVWDEDGNVDGLQFDGRERRLQEWRDRKEAIEFEKLCQSLRNRNRIERIKQADQARYQQMRENQDEWRRRNIEHVRKARNARRKAKYQADPVVCKCQECGATWCVVYEKRSQKASKFCGKKCRLKVDSRKASRKRNRGLRKMNVRQLITDLLLANPGSTADQVADSIGSKVGSTRTLCSRMAKEGDLVSDGGKPARYSVMTGGGPVGRDDSNGESA